MASSQTVHNTKASATIDNPKVSSPYGVFTGEVDTPLFDSLISILADGMHLEEKTLEGMKTFMKSQDKAVIYNKTTKEVYTDMRKRNCNRFTFNDKIVSQLSNLLLPVISEQIGEKASDVQIHPTHGDVMYYPVGGEFKWHCDEVLECPYEGEWAFNSLILCLSSSGETGSTVIHISSENHRINSYYELKKGPKDDTNDLIFKESIIPQNYLIFPADVPHKSMPIVSNWTSPEPYKMVLKLDIWFKIPETPGDEIQLWDYLDKYKEHFYGYADSKYDEIEEYYEYGDELDECNGYC